MEDHNNVNPCKVCKKTEPETKSWGSRRKKYHKKCLLSDLAYTRFGIKAIQENQSEKNLPEVVKEFMQEYYNSGSASDGFDSMVNWLNESIENIMRNWETIEEYKSKYVNK